jgi:hypothetical protein
VEIRIGGIFIIYTNESAKKLHFFEKRRRKWSVYYKFHKNYSNTQFLSTLHLLICKLFFALRSVTVILREWVEALLLLPNFLSLWRPILSIKVAL